jgi:hypothetical protein
MPVVINEIVITTNIENNRTGADSSQVAVENLVKEAVEKVLEILEEKQHRLLWLYSK